MFVFLNNFCTKDKGVPIQETTEETCKSKYMEDVKPIIVAKCAINGCHVSYFPFGDFTSYTDLKIEIDKGRVKTLVYENDLMPPANSIKLTSDELETLKSWVNDGAKEN